MCKNLCTIVLYVIAATKGVFAEEEAIVVMSDIGLQQSYANEDEKVLNVSNLVVRECTDSKFKFKVNFPKKLVSCEWVRRENTEGRCKRRGVAKTCPFTCNTCSVCNDSLVGQHVEPALICKPLRNYITAPTVIPGVETTIGYKIQSIAIGME